MGHREQFICLFFSQCSHQSLTIEQCTLQIYIKQAVATSKLYTKFLITSCSSLFVWFSFVLICPKQRKTKMAEMNLG